MTERERWIVYPLLFFALGAALRDKFTKEVNTEGLHARQITCQELLLIDPQNPHQPLAALRPTAVGERRVGSLLLTDDRGQSLFGLVEDRLEMRGVRCQGIEVVDPVNGRTLAALTSAVARSNTPGAPPQRLGTLVLNNQKYSTVFAFPFSADREAAPPSPAPPAEKPAP